MTGSAAAASASTAAAFSAGFIGGRGADDSFFDEGATSLRRFGGAGVSEAGSAAAAAGATGGTGIEGADGAGAAAAGTAIGASPG